MKEESHVEGAQNKKLGGKDFLFYRHKEQIAIRSEEAKKESFWQIKELDGKNSNMHAREAIGFQAAGRHDGNTGKFWGNLESFKYIENLGE